MKNSAIRGTTARILYLSLLMVSSAGQVWCAGPIQEVGYTGPTDLNPPRNPFLADSTWPMTHAGPYNQASTASIAPRRPSEALPSFLAGEPVPITLAISSAYPDGSRVVWGKTLQHITKVDVLSGKMNYFAKTVRENEVHNALSGAYSLVDRDGTFFAPQGAFIEAYTDAVPGDPESAIQLRHEFRIPERFNGRAARHSIVGMNLTYDGRIAFVTQLGLVGTLSRTLNDPEFLQLDLDLDESITNSIAVDESGGVFIVTSKRVHRVNWDSSAAAPLSHAWATAYKTSQSRRKGRLGVGSGTTPSLVGTGGQDQFVAIGDGQDLMHMVLIWRGDIPEDWEGLPGCDRRIAAEVPVTFGNPDAERSTTEQSITVHGYGLVTVSNLYGELGPVLRRLYSTRGVDIHHATIHSSNRTRIAPYGVERFTWDPQSRKLVSTWANPTISCPNGVPSMSSATGLFYCIGQRNANWTLEAIDWETGNSAFHQVLSRATQNNSFYAATEIGPDGMILTGTYGGILRFRRDSLSGGLALVH